MRPRSSLGSRNVVGARVTELRERMNLKQKDLLARLQAEGVEISKTGLSELERQIRIVRDFEVIILARVLKTSVEYLLEGRSNS